MSDDDDWEDPFDNDDDNDTDTDTEWPSDAVQDIAYFEYENENLLEPGEDADEYEMKMTEHQKHFIGSYVISRDIVIENNEMVEYEPKLFHGVSILAKTFFRFPINHVLEYLKYYTVESFYPEGTEGAEGPEDNRYIGPNQMKIHVLQLFIEPVSREPLQWISTIVLKTFWISLIQRHWRSILKERARNIQKMKGYSYLKKREISVKYRPFHYPRLRGMMSSYLHVNQISQKKNKKQ